MKRIASGSTGVDNGSCILFSDFADGGVMWTGQGGRENRQAVRFAEPFVTAPMVMVSISMWDIGSGQNSRADIAAECVTTAGFDLVFRTWGDTRVARIRANWMAIGEVRDEERWQVE